jgi:hypothetical protein
VIKTGTPKVRIDEATHIYTRLSDGVVVPSNTQVLRFSGHGVSNFYTEDGREVGKAAHLACRFYDEGRLDWASLEPPLGDDQKTVLLKLKVKKRLESYIKFREDTVFTADLVEFLAYSEELNVAGQIDRTGTFWGSDRHVLLDLKGGAEHDWHGYQTAGYTLMEFPTNPYHITRGCVYLKDDGSRAKLRLHKKASDFDEFISCVQRFHRENT